MTVRVSPEARWDIIEAARFYDDQETGCGAMFLAHVERLVGDLAHLAGIHARHQGYYRALASPRFPYAVYYLIYGDDVIVMAVQDCRRDPAKIKSVLQARRPTN